MRQSEFQKQHQNYIAEGVTFTPRTYYKDAIPILEEEEIVDYELTQFELLATAEEVYQEWLEQKDLPPQPSEMELLKQEIHSLKEQQTLFKEQQLIFEESQATQDFIIDDLVFEVIPSLEVQISNGSATKEDITLLIKQFKKEGNDGMAGYLAKKIIEGRDYKVVFSTNAYKQYQDEVDTILELEGRGDLIKRGIFG